MHSALDHHSLYRLPWSLPDNSISWLEPTAACNLACLGCYRINEANAHKSLEEVGRELDVFTRLRKADGISVAGGDPLMHPQIIDIVSMIKERGIKPIMNTNGLALTRELLVELKKAGLWGLTFHIDSKQGRPKWRGADEIDLNELRLEYAEMVADVGDLTCSFNATVYGDTLKQVPDVVAWGQKHIDKVHVLVFIAFRAGMINGDFDYYAGGKKIDISPMPYSAEEATRIDIQSTDVLEVIRERFPEFTPSAYLNGTQRPDSYKWLLTGRIGTKDRIYGYTGRKFMELSQTVHHWRHDRYLAYSKARVHKRGRAMMMLAPFDRGVRRIGASYLKTLIGHPIQALRRAHFQSIMLIQPADLLADGRTDMCDSCPDMTVHNDELAWSCRLEEVLEYGQFVDIVPKTPVHVN